MAKNNAATKATGKAGKSKGAPASVITKGPKMQSAGASPIIARDTFGSRFDARTGRIHFVLYAASGPLSTREIEELAQCKATYNHLCTLWRAERIKYEGGRWAMTKAAKAEYAPSMKLPGAPKLPARKGK